MHLIAGLPLPVEMRLFLHGFQDFFPSREWKTMPLLYLPLVSFGRMQPQVWEELDQTLYTLHLPAPATLRHTGFDVSLKRNRIMLEATVEASVIDHLSVKIRNQARLAGVSSTHSSSPRALPWQTLPMWTRMCAIYGLQPTAISLPRQKKFANSPCSRLEKTVKTLFGR